MRWTPVRGRGDVVRRIALPDYEREMDLNRLLFGRDSDPKIDSQLTHARVRWAQRAQLRQRQDEEMDLENELQLRLDSRRAERRRFPRGAPHDARMLNPPPGGFTKLPGPESVGGRYRGPSTMPSIMERWVWERIGAEPKQGWPKSQRPERIPPMPMPEKKYRRKGK